VFFVKLSGLYCGVLNIIPASQGVCFKKKSQNTLLLSILVQSRDLNYALSKFIDLDGTPLRTWICTFKIYEHR
jgi:hypothetical protein